eukprot:TRINITY_DN34841_c0_g6_i2.p1 TRINITY_DN34841_c0_g6~~TRINITY_DN34841_c0_g6_i2.p1  ORF type:complete len:350 (-),score=84.23 TRINITY_DN34841_c0_g6_i2:67-1116(-)
MRQRHCRLYGCGCFPHSTEAVRPWHYARSKAAVEQTLTIKRGSRGGICGVSLSDTARASVKSFDPLERTESAEGAIHGKCCTWVRGEILGSGSLGKVFKALDQETGRIFASKEVLIDRSDADDLKFKQALENEISICKDLQHPRIVSYLGHDNIGDCLFVYLEYMPGGCLASVLAQFGPLEEELVALYAKALLEGVDYLHTRDPPVLHRDIKGANVLVGLDCGVKLADFGCSKRTTDTMSRTMKGSIPWMAPEMMAQAGYTYKADIWSFGCLCVEMSSKERMPWGQKFNNIVTAMYKICMSKETPPVPDCLSSTCKDFIGRCLQRDVEARPSASELLQHELVRDLVIDE